MKSLKFFLFSLLLLSTNLIYSNSNWSYTNGWALKNGDKFFVIGAFNIPYYTRHVEPLTTNQNIEIFNSACNYYNLLFLKDRYFQNYMKDSIVLLSGFQQFEDWIKWQTNPQYNHIIWSLTENFIDLDSDSFLSYQEMKNFRDSLYFRFNGPPFIDFLRGPVLSDLKPKQYTYNFIWYTAGEPDQGRNKGWFWYPEILHAMDSAVFESFGDTILMYTDMCGHVTASKFFWEEVYVDTIDTLPDSLPQGTRNYIPFLEGSLDDLASYIYSWDGSYCMKYPDNNGTGKWYFSPMLEDTSIMLENVRQLVKAYDSRNRILGVNSYKEFYYYPVLAGRIVDVIREEYSDSMKPIWLCFDANNNVEYHLAPAVLFQSVKCQVYTSIIHGASGCMFWACTDYNFGFDSIYYYDFIVPFLRELDSLSFIYKGDDNVLLPMSNKNWKQIGDLHYAIRYVENTNDTFFIVSNTSRENPVIFKPSGFDTPEYILEPLQASIIHFKRDNKIDFIAWKDSLMFPFFSQTNNFLRQDTILIWSGNSQHSAYTPDNVKVCFLNDDKYIDFIAQVNEWISPHINRRDGTFEKWTGFDVWDYTQSDPVGIEIGDFNGDGYDDFVVWKDTLICIYYNYDGFSNSDSLFYVEHVFEEIKVADFNGDRYADLLIYNDEWVKPLIYDNNIKSFSYSYSGFDVWNPTLNDPEGIEIGDFNGDSRDDFLAWRDSIAIVFLAKNDSGEFNSFSFQVWTGTVNHSAYTPNDILIGDFNGDGYDDFIAWVNEWIQPEISAGNGSFIKWDGFDVWNYQLSDPSGLKIGDFNGDFKGDFMIWKDSIIVPFFSNGNTGFVRQDTVLAWLYDPSQGSQSGDECRDNEIVDIIVGNFNGTGYEVDFYNSNSPQIIKSNNTLNLSNNDHIFNLYPITYSFLNNDVSINYSIPSNGFVTLKIYDISGRTVANIVNEYQQAGYYTTRLYREDLVNGVFFCRLTCNNLSDTQKLILIK